MSHSSRSSLAAQGAAALAAALTFAGAAAPALAQDRPDPPLPMPRLFSHDAGATRYSTPGGAIRFTFDRSGDRVALCPGVARREIVAGRGDAGQFLLRRHLRGLRAKRGRQHEEEEAGGKRGVRRQTGREGQGHGSMVSKKGHRSAAPGLFAQWRV